MTYCRYHIIANSTFSWWGAWLADEPNLVVAPFPWFDSEDHISKDIYHDNWVLLDKKSGATR